MAAQLPHLFPLGVAVQRDRPCRRTVRLNTNPTPTHTHTHTTPTPHPWAGVAHETTLQIFE